jgi:hypothetical protein
MFSGPGEFVTQKGYLNKIGLLFPGYTLSESDADFLKNKGLGYKSSFIERGGHIGGYNLGSSDVGVGAGIGLGF